MLNQFNSNTRKLNRVVPKINTSNLMDTDLTGSLQNIMANSMPISNKFNSNSRSNPNPIKVVNNKTTINEFHLEILQHSGMLIKIKIDEFDNIKNTLTIHNIHTDYGTEGASPYNFEILVYGLHIPGDYIVKDIGNNVVVTLNDRYIDFDNITLDDIYVIGKLRYLNLDTENILDILTEDGNEIII